MNVTLFYDQMPSTPLPTSDKSEFILDVVTTILAALGVVGNSFVLIVIGCVKELRGVTNLLIANQSLIDLLTSLLVFLWWIPPIPVSEDHPVRGEIVCVIFDNSYFFLGIHSGVNIQPDLHQSRALLRRVTSHQIQETYHHSKRGADSSFALGNSIHLPALFLVLYSCRGHNLSINLVQFCPVCSRS